MPLFVVLATVFIVPAITNYGGWADRLGRAARMLRGACADDWTEAHRLL